jgi:hypothetical protein
MSALYNIWISFQNSSKLGIYGPKVAAVGVLLVQAGYILQGKFEEIDYDSTALAVALLFTRSNLVTSQDVKARPDASK